ncbi:MAG: Na/Pi cotransporter family protein [Candidatus Dormibacteraeota bacterium]|nr:Na/Pi cotransporter family protein [Candidatus Dormibacteraeota bacterium]
MKILLNLLAGVGLLVWGTHIVRTGILRIWGGDLRRFLRESVSNRHAAFAAGLGITALIQSSTATAVMVASFVGQGLIATAPALAVMLGADVGTALMTLVFSFDLSWLSPLLIFLGVTLFMRRESSQIGRFGQILIGLGLIILALQLIVLAAQPLTKGAGVKVIFGSLTGDVLLDMLVAAVFTMLSYSSLAVVLLTATLAASKVISLHVALGLVLGANLGSGLLAMLTTLTSSPEARRVTLGNLLFRLLGCIIIVPLLPYIEELFASTPLDDAQITVYFHLLFNVAIAVGFLFFTEKIARVAERLLPDRHDVDDPAKARYLDPSALDTPKLAIGNAAREAMRLADFIEQMLNGMLAVLKTNDRELAEKIRKMDDIVDDLYTAIKLYLTQVSREALDEKEGRRWADIVSFTINMEQVGDIVERVVTDLEEKKIEKGRSFSAAGMQEICDLHGRLIANLRLGMSVFLHGDLSSAQQLLHEKVLFRDLERAYADSHIERLSINTLQSIETSSLHLDLISDLKRINSHICSIAYPILEHAGVLAKTRLREAPAPPAPPAGESAAPEVPGSKDSWQKRKPRPA